MGTRDELLYGDFPKPYEPKNSLKNDAIVSQQNYLNDLAIPSMNLAMFNKSRDGAMRAVAKSKRLYK